MENAVKQVDAVFIYIIGFSLVLLLGITAVMIYFAIRYRQSRNPVSSDIRNNFKLEIAWMIIPSIIALSMFYFGWQSFLGLRNVPGNAVEIEVTGMQFAWVFTYKNSRQSEGVLVVPQGRPIKLNITSIDVLHGFFIPAFRIKIDAIRNMKTYAWFYADKPGTYNIFCTQFCGTGHADMSATLKIVPEYEYREWLDKKP